MYDIELVENTPDNELWKLFLLADPSIDVVLEYINDSEIYIAKDNGKIIGAYVLYEHNNTEYEIKNIAVTPEFQNKGVGYCMLIHAKSKLMKAGNIILIICTGNTSKHQINLYQKVGFTITSVNKGFFLTNYPKPIYENGLRCEDLVIMSQLCGKKA